MDSLIKRAIELYEDGAGWNTWIFSFTDSELNQLWEACCNDLNLPFDDEVYDALNMRGGVFD